MANADAEPTRIALRAPTFAPPVSAFLFCNGARKIAEVPGPPGQAGEPISSKHHKQTKGIMNNKCDEVAKGLAQSVTRRQAFKRFGVGLAGMVLACLGLPNNAEAGNS